MEAWTDNAIILNIRGHGENGGVVSVFSKDVGRFVGYVHGAKSSSKRAILQPGNLVQANWQARSSENLGLFSFESETDYAAHLMRAPQRLLALQSACALLSQCLPEREKHESLYHGTLALFDNLEGDVWAEMYVLWELAFLKEMGFGVDLTKCAGGGDSSDLSFVSPKSGIGVSSEKGSEYADKMLKLPKFLKGEGEGGKEDVLDGLKLTAYFIEHRLLGDTTFKELPEARQRLQECFV